MLCRICAEENCRKRRPNDIEGAPGIGLGDITDNRWWEGTIGVELAHACGREGRRI